MIRRASAGQQVGVQAGLGFVEHHQRRWPRGEQGGDQQQVAQGAVGQLGRRQRAQQPLLAQGDAEAPARLAVDAQLRAGKGIGDGTLQRLAVADLADGLQRGRQVAAVVVQHRRAGAQLWLACRRLGVGAEVVVEAPAADGLAQLEYLGTAGVVADLVEQAVVARQVLGQHLPAAPLALAHHGAFAVHQQGCRAVAGPGPDALALDLRVEGEGRVRGCRQAQGDGVAEVLAGEAQAQAHHLAARAALDRHLAALHAPADLFRPGPDGRLQAAVAGQRVDHPAARRLGQQAQGAVQVGLAAAVGAGDQVQPAERDHQVVDGAVVADGEGMQHGSRPDLRRPILARLVPRYAAPPGVRWRRS